MAAIPTGIKVAAMEVYRAPGGWLEGTVTFATDPGDNVASAALATWIEGLTPASEWTLKKYDGLFGAGNALTVDLEVRFLDLPVAVRFGPGGIAEPVTLAWAQS